MRRWIQTCGWAFWRSFWRTRSSTLPILPSGSISPTARSRRTSKNCTRRGSSRSLRPRASAARRRSARSPRTRSSSIFSPARARRAGWSRRVSTSDSMPTMTRTPPAAWQRASTSWAGLTIPPAFPIPSASTPVLYGWRTGTSSTLFPTTSPRAPSLQSFRSPWRSLPKRPAMSLTIRATSIFRSTERCSASIGARGNTTTARVR